LLKKIVDDSSDSAGCFVEPDRVLSHYGRGLDQENIDEHFSDRREFSGLFIPFSATIFVVVVSG